MARLEMIDEDAVPVVPAPANPKRAARQVVLQYLKSSMGRVWHLQPGAFSMTQKLPAGTMLAIKDPTGAVGYVDVLFKPLLLKDAAPAEFRFANPFAPQVVDLKISWNESNE